MRVEIEPVEIRHLAFLKNLRNEPDVMDFCRQPKPLTQQNQEDWYKSISKTQDFTPFVVSDLDLERDKQWVGYCALSHIDPIADKAEFSCVIHPSHKDKGYGKEAIFQLLYFGFHHLGLQKIYSDTFEYSPKEVELNKECGFTVDGYLPRHYFKRGRLVGSVPMSILREKFSEVWRDRLVRITHSESKPL